jgi:hypothetical protein
MISVESVRDRALDLARQEPDVDAAIRSLERYCAGEQVSAVMARDELSLWLEDVPGHRAAKRALELLDEVLGEGDPA